MSLKKTLRRVLLKIAPELMSRIIESWVRVPQPRNAKARVVLTALTPGGAGADGKVSKRDFLPTFCDTLRRNDIATAWVSSTRELSRALRVEEPVVLIHLFGEDRNQIESPELAELEQRAVATFNRSGIGPLLADKLDSHRAFAAAGIPVPDLREAGGFVRSRLGTGLPTAITPNDTSVTRQEDDRQIRTEFVDTRVEFGNRRYFTSIRLLCIDNVVLHAYPRARDDQEGDASVHAHDTPADPALIEHLHKSLVQPRSVEFTSIAQQLYEVLGHGFYVHDLVIEAATGAVFVCETGFKFDDAAYWRHLEPIASRIPSQSVLFPVQQFAQYSAGVFLERCQSILAASHSDEGTAN